MKEERNHSLELYKKKARENEEGKEMAINFFVALYSKKLIDRLNYNIKNYFKTNASCDYHKLHYYDEEEFQKATGIKSSRGEYWIRSYKDDICLGTMEELEKQGYGVRADMLLAKFYGIEIELSPPKTKKNKFINRLFGGR